MAQIPAADVDSNPAINTPNITAAVLRSCTTLRRALSHWFHVCRDRDRDRDKDRDRDRDEKRFATINWQHVSSVPDGQQAMLANSL